MRKPRWNGDWIGFTFAVVAIVIILVFVVLTAFFNH